jgi:protein-export membrane protein SecD
MLQFPPWKLAIVFVVLIWGAVTALPNVMKTSGLPEWMPRKPVSLGLDLKGGVYLMTEIRPEEVVAGRLEVLARDANAALRGGGGAQRVYFLPEVRGRTLDVRLTDANTDLATAKSEALARLRKLNAPVTGAVGNAMMYEIRDAGPNLITVDIPAIAEEALMKEALDKTETIVRRRLDPDGVSEIGITRQGVSRLVIEAPGEPDPERLKNLLNRDGRMTFNLVDSDVSRLQAAIAGVPQAGYTLLTSLEGQQMLVRDIPEIVGADIAEAAQAFDQANNPKITFRLNGAGARKFFDTTRLNVGKPFAIVLDNTVMSSPVINQAIAGGSVEITGRFTLDEAKDLAAIISAGEMPAKLQFLDQRVVSPTLGSDSIQKGAMAAIMGLGVVAAFMILAYGLQGVLSVISLLVNIVLIFAGLSSLGAVLTLPGIAGIVLTIGMAVDANVLVFERIREEQANGRSPWTAVQAGYERAFSTIIDANITTLIAAVILYSLGSGPVRGFAATLSIGIISSVFTAFVVTRMMTVGWLKLAKPKRLAI